ncbi:hypothetical protein UJ101_02179 [Flavobacteriaceae bacterium UJ101]|nr:hypothetical protein UJ101_02179 [Flavobacteriaceae bacterium UJ101]
MSKIYTEREHSLKNSEPKSSTIQFILNYSKSIKLIKTKNLGPTFVMKN